MKRKRLITLLMLVSLLAGNAWGESQLYFEHNVIEFANTAADPKISDYYTGESSNIPEPTTPDWTGCYYRQPLLWIPDVSKPDVYNITKMNRVEENDYIITVSTTGDMAIAEGHYKSRTEVETVGSVTRYDYVLNNTELYFTGNSGTIKLTATQPDYLGVTYTASYTIAYHMSSKKWNFYSKTLAVGRMEDPSSSLYTHQDEWTKNETGGAGEYVYFFKNAIGSVDGGVTTYADASNAGPHIIETDGLKFYAPAETFGLYNENTDLDNAVADRFIALKQGAEVVIPASYFIGLSNPRIRIKMGRYGAPSAGSGSTHEGAACIDLTITNGKDALGNNIIGQGTYVIGGSTWWGDKRDPHQRGEYHFQIQDKDADFKIKVEYGQWLKLYTIEVYDFTELLTENSVLGTNYQLLTKKNGNTVDNSRASGTYYLHYRGKGEHTRVFTNYTSSDPWTYCPTGTVVCNNSSFTNYDGGETHTYTATEGQFGTFQMRLACYTHYNNYCTDYADRSQAVGYLETKSYPYTWDFTDVATYEGGAGRMGTAGQGTDNYGEGDYIYYGRFNKRYHWHETSSGNYGHRVGVTADGHKITFCGGSQLWYGKTMIPELEGLGFTPSNYSSTYNNTLQIISGTEGIKINQGTTTWWCYRVAVPNVPANGVVYVRVHPERTDAYYNVGYSYGDFDKANNKEIAFGSEKDTYGTYHALATDGSGDMIYAVPGNETSASSNITLYFNGVTIKKIAVSTDKKTFNAKGWTTESRDHDIDPSLTAEMNGRGIKTFAVTDVKYDKKHVTMTDISNEGLMPAATDDSQYACILRNTEDAAFEVVNGGFYLFVPDMHDKQGTDTSGLEEAQKSNWNQKNYASSMESSKMKAKVSHAYPAGYPNSNSSASGTRIPATSGDYTNFAFTYQYYQLDDEGNRTTSEKLNGPQGFYRIAAGGAYSLGNQGYLPLETSKLSTDVVNSARGFELAFDDDEEGSEVTAIENIEASKSDVLVKGAVYYSLSGQQLSGKPAKGGIYICNGKKVIIK